MATVTLACLGGTPIEPCPLMNPQKGEKQIPDRTMKMRGITMERILAVAIASLLSSLATGIAFANETELKLGTEIEILLLDGLNTKDSAQGDTFRAFLQRPITTDDGRAVIAPEGNAVQGKISELRSGKFGGAIRAKRRAKIAITVIAIEINDEMTPIKATTNVLEMARGGNVVGRAVAGAAAGALGSSLVGSNQKMQTTAAAVGAMLGMLGKAKQLTLPVETEMHFLLAETLPVSVVPRDPPGPVVAEKQISAYSIEINIDGHATVVSLEQSLVLLRTAVENYTAQESTDLIATIDALELRLQTLTEAKESNSDTIKANSDTIEANSDTIEELIADIKEVEERVKKLENPTLIARLRRAPFFSSIGIFGFLATLAYTGSVRDSVRAARGEPLKVRIRAWRLSVMELHSRNRVFMGFFYVFYIGTLIVGHYFVQDIGWIFGGLLVLIAPNVPVLLSGVQILSD